MYLKTKRYLIVSAALLFLLPLAHTAYGQDEVTTSDDTPTSVSPPHRPTRVTVGAYLLGLSRVSAPSAAFPRFEAEMFLDLSWRDERLVFPSEDGEPMVFLEEEAEEKLSEIWAPDLEIQNEVEHRITESIELIIFADGTVQYEERFGAFVGADLDLRRFPFDRQTFDLEIQSFVWNQNDVILVVNEQQLGMESEFQTPEWTVTGIEALQSLNSEIRDDRAFSTYTFRIHARRGAGHYLLRVLAPLMFVMLLTWVAFWAAPSERIGIGFIAMLTVVATHTVISQSLPRLQYPTFGDILLIVCYAFATVLIVESTWVKRLEARGLENLAKKIELRTRWILPVVAMAVIGISVLLLWQ